MDCPTNEIHEIKCPTNRNDLTVAVLANVLVDKLKI